MSLESCFAGKISEILFNCLPRNSSKLLAVTVTAERDVEGDRLEEAVEDGDSRLPTVV